MNATPTGPWSTSSPPPVEPPGGTGAKPVSSAGYWISGVILVLGVGGAIAWFALSIFGMFNSVDDFQRVGVPGTLETRLEAGTFTLYDEFPGASTTFKSAPDVRVTGPAGETIPVQTTFVSSTYTFGDHEGRAFGEIDVPVAGNYRFVVRGEPRGTAGEQVAIGKGIVDLAAVGGILGSIALGGLAFVVGLIIFVITIVRRSRSRRANSPRIPPYPPGGYGPGGYGPSGGYTPSPYPPGVAPPGGPPAPGWPPPGPPQPGWGPPTSPSPGSAPPGVSPTPASAPPPWSPPGRGSPPS